MRHSGSLRDRPRAEPCRLQIHNLEPPSPIRRRPLVCQQPDLLERIVHGLLLSAASARHAFIFRKDNFFTFVLPPDFVPDRRPEREPFSAQ
jgi:hypothetical protein